MLTLLAALFVVALAAVAYHCRSARQSYRPNTIGFLHPFAGAGGGGERVLWVSVAAIQQDDIRRNIDRDYIIYTNPYDGDAAHLLALVQSQFNIHLPRPIQLVALHPQLTKWVRGDLYPRLTLVLQTFFGGACLFVNAALLHRPTPIVVETIGVPFVYPLFRLLCGSVVISYTHYPIITSTMVGRVSKGEVAYNNSAMVARCSPLRYLKMAYYYTFMGVYRLLLFFPHVVLVNSSWTRGHMERLMWPKTCKLLFPPCDGVELMRGSKDASERNNNIVSVGQYRPEKNHMLQLEAFHLALSALPPSSRLVMVGGTRDQSDRARVEALKRRAKELGVDDRVDIRTNVKYSEIKEELNQCSIGLHTMTDEHFGIVVLEYLAAGCVALAHNSGGVAIDIIQSRELGFLATTREEYADAMTTILRMRSTEPEAFRRIQKCAAAHVRKFGDEEFSQQLVNLLRTYL